MIVETGLSVTLRTWFRIASPLFGSLVSTSITPPCVTNTVVLPPAPGITYRLSRTFLIVPVGGIRGRGCCAAAPATAKPTTTIAERILLRRIFLLHVSGIDLTDAVAFASQRRRQARTKLYCSAFRT